MPSPLLHGYQRRWLADPARFRIGMFARQTGKTFSTTLESAMDALEGEVAGRPTRWVILSRGERQAKEAIEEGVKRHLKAFGAAFTDLDYDWDAGAVSYRAMEVALPGGSRITALPANPDTARGFSANVMLDEFAFHTDSRKIWQALFPVISAGWKLRVVSTPNGKGNKFYELMTGQNDEWSRHVVDIYQAVADGLPRDIAQLRKAIGDEDAWAQEFELKWLDEASSWLSYELISSVEHPDAGNPDLYEGGQCFIGNDIAARGDLWVAWVWELVGDVFWCREIVRLKRAKFADHDAVMAELFRRYRVTRLGMDQTGMGEKPVEDMIRLYGSTRVNGVLFTSAAKLELATIGKQMFEDSRVRIPMGDPVLRADMHKLRKVTSATGIPRFVAESDANGHADHAWAAFLGLAVGAHPPAPIEFRSTGERRSSVGADGERRANVEGWRAWRDGVTEEEWR